MRQGPERLVSESGLHERHGPAISLHRLCPRGRRQCTQHPLVQLLRRNRYLIGAGTIVAGIVGTALHVGLTSGDGAEYEWLCNVRFDNDSWKSAPRTIISNAPASDEDRLALDTYTSSHVVGGRSA